MENIRNEVTRDRASVNEINNIEMLLQDSTSSEMRFLPSYDLENPVSAGHLMSGMKHVVKLGFYNVL